MSRRRTILPSVGAILLVAAFLSKVPQEIWRWLQLQRSNRALLVAADACPIPTQQRGVWSITLITASDCATCREHVAVWEARPASADSVKHALLAYSTPRRRLETEAALRAQSTRPICIDTVGTWLRHRPDKRMPATLLFVGKRHVDTWWGELSTPSSITRVWRRVDSLRAATGKLAS